MVPSKQRQKTSEGPPTTLVLCAPDDYAMDELTTTVTNSIKVLNQLLRNTVVFAGGGCTELHIANHLKSKVSVLKEGRTYRF